MPAMSDPTVLPFAFSSVRAKKLTAAFDGGRLSSDGGVLLLAQAARTVGHRREARCGDPGPARSSRIVHPLPEILLARILAIACGYEDADDLDHLRADPAFKLACGRLPESGVDLMSQPTVSRLENTPGLRDLIRLGRVLVDLYCASYATPPRPVTLDIDDTCDVVHGQQQLFRCSTPTTMRAAFSHPRLRHCHLNARWAMILRPGKTPSGREVRGHLPASSVRSPSLAKTAITIRGDGH